MAHFFSRIQGNREAVTRLGSKNSGITAEARGWNVGAVIVGNHRSGRDYFHFYANGGSNNGNREYIGKVFLNDSGEFVFKPAE